MESKKENVKRKCEKCNKTLRPIGDKRENGALHICDWEDRKYHKSCWKKICEERNLLKTIAKFNQSTK